MKAKDLAEQLLQTPDLEIVILDSEYDPEIAKGLVLGKIAENCFYSLSDLEDLQKNVDEFEKHRISAEYHRSNASKYCSLEEYTINYTRSHELRVTFLEKINAAPFVLSLI